VTPFADFVHRYCQSRHLRQKELAYQTGVDASYLSALVSGRKGAPSEGLIKKMRENLELTDVERRDLEEAARLSQKWYEVPPQANPGEYVLINKIFDSVGNLKPAQIGAIIEVLKL
jgi:transcriptional regulator with XRE-family HTH domain